MHLTFLCQVAAITPPLSVLATAFEHERLLLGLFASIPCKLTILPPLQVPTIDTVRNSFVASSLVRNFNHTMVVGNVGVGKTMIIQSMLDSLPSDRASMIINFSAQTTSNSLQDTIEGRLEKRTKGVFAPAGGKKLVSACVGPWACLRLQATRSRFASKSIASNVGCFCGCECDGWSEGCRGRSESVPVLEGLGFDC
eukprot:1157259-Pelagomonas_calceolata.AAC.16